MKIFNSLSRKVEEIEKKPGDKIGVYTCGPTVYDYVTIGNWRTYTLGDLVVRTLKFLGYDVSYVMNITDVGHLTGDNLGDADIGEDRLVKEAKKERKTAWDIAQFYIEAFFNDFDKLNLEKPEVFARATDNIREQIALAKKLEENGLTYKTSDGIYFDTVRYEKTTKNKYGELSNLDKIKEGARVEINPEKKNPRDFALWKFSPSSEKRDMEWDSPWGMGFPGWHLECSAMSMKYLGETFDIHVGGEDLRSTHHPNEIAQSQGATGKKFVDFWVHGAFLMVDGGRMGKSLGNAYTISDLEKKGFSALDLRYFYLSGKYNEPLNFTWESLKAAQNAFKKLREQVAAMKAQTQRTTLSFDKQKRIEDFRIQFLQAVNDDLNTPRSLAILWETLKSNIPSEDKYDLAISFDEVLGLKLSEISKTEEISGEIRKLMEKREKLRKENNFEEADQIRKQIEDAGYKVKDSSL